MNGQEFAFICVKLLKDKPLNSHGCNCNKTIIDSVWNHAKLFPFLFVKTLQNDVIFPPLYNFVPLCAKSPEDRNIFAKDSIMKTPNMNLSANWLLVVESHQSQKRATIYHLQWLKMMIQQTLKNAHNASQDPRGLLLFIYFCMKVVATLLKGIPFI